MDLSKLSTRIESPAWKYTSSVVQQQYWGRIAIEIKIIREAASEGFMKKRVEKKDNARKTLLMQESEILAQFRRQYLLCRAEIFDAAPNLTTLFIRPIQNPTDIFKPNQFAIGNRSSCRLLLFKL